MQKKIQIGLLVVSFLILGIAGVMDYTNRPSNNFEDYTKGLESYIHGLEADWERVYTSPKGIGKMDLMKSNEEGILKNNLYDKPYTILKFKGGKLTFWNNVDVGMELDFIEDEKREFVTSLVDFPNGYFYVRKEELPDSVELFAFFPIKHKYNIESIYLKNRYAVDGKLRLPDNLKVLPPDEGMVVKNKVGNGIFSISSDGELGNSYTSRWVFYLYCFGIAIFIIVFTSWCQQLSRRRKPWMGVVALGGGLFLLRCLSIFSGFMERFEGIPVFANKYSSNIFSDSLGGMLINASLVLWLAIFFHREFHISQNKDYNKFARFGGVVLSYSAIICGILIVTYVLRGLVLDANIPFDFDNVANFELNGFLSVLGILFLMLMLFLFTHRISIIISQLGLDLYTRLGSIAGAVLFVFLGVAILGLDLPILLLILFAIIYIVSFDLFVEQESISFEWIVIWLVIFSGFSSSFLYKYTVLKESKQRENYAKYLSNTREQKMEEKLIQLKKEITSDGEIISMMDDADDYYPLKNLLEKNHTVDLRFPTYKYSFDIFDMDSLGNITPIGNSNLKMLEKHDRGEIAGDESIRFVGENNEGLGTYMLRLEWGLASGRKLMLFEFNRTTSVNQKVDTEIFLNEELKQFQGLGKYEYAIYKDNRLVEDSDGKGYAMTISDATGLPEKGEFRMENSESKSHLTYRASNGNVVMISKKRPQLLEEFYSLFSYLFTVMVLLLSVLALLNGLLSILPFNIIQDSYNSPPSLKNKIQISVISVIIISFLVIGMVTIFYFDSSNEEYHEGRLNRKARSISSDADREVDILDITSSSLEKLEMIPEPLSKIHRLDVNVYSLEGKLVSSSMREIFSKGLMTPLMNPVAYYDLKIRGNTESDEMDEQIGDLQYTAKYKALTGNNGEVIAYLGMPYYDKQSRSKNDSSEFISTLLNVYVFLLLVAGGIAIFVANSITRPISVMGEKLKQVKLNKKNEPLEWGGKDELGVLVSEYNKMITKLEDSASLLAQSEREGAWREMAKQVAHEIKNPLTPMKLSIQYLQHAYYQNPENIEPMLKRVSNTLIEQIDNLSHIATSFSNFAKMPRAENEYFVVNTLVQSVFDLFSEGEDLDMGINLINQDLTVLADKNQLMRVLNNLIKNAQQSIPEERKGHIEVILTKENAKARIEVRDNGTGIADDMEEFIFVPHITTKKSGTGLGLAMSKSIIEALGGEIYFKSIYGEGTSFFIELPIAEEDA